MTTACRTCDHFLPAGRSSADEDPRNRHDAVELGVCRRFPPRVLIHPEDGDHDTRWPEVHRAHRCGEWVPNETVLPI